MNNSLLSHASIASAAAARLLSASGFRSASFAPKSTAARVVARMNLGENAEPVKMRWEIKLAGIPRRWQVAEEAGEGNLVAIHWRLADPKHVDFRAGCARGVVRCIAGRDRLQPHREMRARQF